MEKADIPFLPASQLSQLIHDRAVSPVEAVEAYLDRIDNLNPKLYAYLTVCRDEALAAARDAERAISRGESRGPLHGIPFAVKDQLNTAGIRTTSGTPIFNDFVPDEDATVVARLKWDIPVPDYRQALDANLANTKVGVVKELLYSDVVEPEVGDAVSKAAESLAALGAQVNEISIPLAAHSNVISTILRVEAPTNHRDLIRNRIQEINHDNRIAYQTWSLIPAMAYYKGLKLRALLRQQVLDAFTRFNVLLSPTMAASPPDISPDQSITSKANTLRNRSGLTTTYSLASAPALSICCGFTAANLPIGLQLGSKPFDEQAILNTAYAYEQNTDWHNRWPPI